MNPRASFLRLKIFFPPLQHTARVQNASELQPRIIKIPESLLTGRGNILEYLAARSVLVDSDCLLFF